jgi:hypothetical protein
MKLYSKEGVEMMDIKSIDQDGDTIVIKGKMMKSMAATIHVQPEGVWEAYRLFPMKLILRLPALLLKGRKVSRTKAEADAKT